jgi:hypothetical protein
MKNDARTTNDSPENDDIKTLINDGSSKNSSGASLNQQRLAQDDSYTIMNETTEAKRNEELINEPYVGAADEGATSAPREVVTLGDDGIDGKDDLGIVMGTEADVTDEDLLLLGEKEQDMDGGEDEMAAKGGLDDTDFEGEPLNEAAVDMSSTGEDLDMDTEPNNPRTDAMGQGDEENDYYSLGSDKNDNVTEGTP